MADAIVLPALRRCQLFEDFSDESLRGLLGYLQELQGSAGSRLYSQGEPSTGMFIVIEGVCATLVQDPAGVERQIREVGEFESFGELGLVLRGERLVSVAALTDVRVLAMSLESFRRLKSTNPDLCLMVIMAIVRRFGRVVDDSRELFQRLLLRHVTDISQLES